MALARAAESNGVGRFVAADELEHVTGRTFTRHSLGSLEDLRTAIGQEQDPYAGMVLWF